MPQLSYKPNTDICLALDPACTLDNSILGATNIVDNPNYGCMGEIVNCLNLSDNAGKKRYKLDSNRRLKEVRNYLSLHDGQYNDYQNTDCLLIDQGAGGGGVSIYADGLLDDLVGDNSRHHRGLIDALHKIYTGYKSCLLHTPPSP